VGDSITSGYQEERKKLVYDLFFIPEEKVIFGARKKRINLEGGSKFEGVQGVGEGSEEKNVQSMHYYMEGDCFEDRGGKEKGFGGVSCSFWMGRERV